MAEYREVIDSIDVPKSTGVEGFFHVLRSILKLPRIQKVNIDVKGHVSYTHYVLDGDRAPIKIDFEGIEPWHIIRNGDVEELQLHTSNAAIVLTSMLDKVTLDKFCPVAFVVGANSIFWGWYLESTGFKLSSDQNICGLPVHRDRQIPDTALILCAAYTKESALIDTQKSYKIEMQYVKLPETVVEVL